jgi:capsular polysaccharide biosynthesis protein
MDLWDVTKLIVRRWYVALPILLVTVIAALWTTSTVKPDYEATTNVTLLPPTVREETNTGKRQTVNPWDTESLTVATLTYLNSKRLHDQMAADGYSQVWSADTDIRFRSLIIIKVTASGPEKAQESARKLQDLVTAEVERQQKAYNLKPGEEITTIPFDNGDNLETKTSKAKRALIVVIGIGMIITVAFTVGLDALLRWRAGRRNPKPNTPLQGGGTPPPAAPGPEGVSARIASTTRSSVDKGGSNGKPPASGEETQRIPLGGLRFQMAGGEERDPQLTQPIKQPAEQSPPPPADDATIVLPLSNPMWGGTKPGSGKPGEKAAEIGKR